MSTIAVPPPNLRTHEERSKALAVTELRHPSEQSRLLLALCGTALVTGIVVIALLATGGLASLGLAIAVLVVFGALVWLALQIYRARMLARAVRVTAASMPGLHATLEAIRDKLAFRRRLDVYVIEDNKPPTQLISYLGTRILVLKGDLIADLVEKDPAQLEFLLARHIGALKARHHLLTPVEVLLTAVESLAFLNFLLLPYHRAAAYTGDQIAQVACGDLDAALRATNRVLVGALIEPQVRAQGVFEQARLVRRRAIPRLAQLFSAEPHPTNRYLNLVLFAKRSEPVAYERYREGLDPENRHALDALDLRSPHRHGVSSPARRRAVAAAWAAVTGAVLVGATVVALGADDVAPVPPPPAPGPVTQPPDVPAPEVLEQSSERALIIPDADTAGVSDALAIASGGTVAGVEVDVSTTHGYRDDLQLRLVSPAGTTVALPTPDGAAVSYDVTNAPELSSLAGESVLGMWELQVSDVDEEDVGTLDGWSLRVETSG